MAAKERRPVTFTRRSMTDLVNRADPRGAMAPAPGYPLPNGKITPTPPEIPGEKYYWAKELPDV